MSPSAGQDRMDEPLLVTTLGEAEFNVAVGLSRLGHRVGWAVIYGPGRW
jgi:sugar/nucleoside kinase (ribokinase family)